MTTTSIPSTPTSVVENAAKAILASCTKQALESSMGQAPGTIHQEPALKAGLSESHRNKLLQVHSNLMAGGRLVLAIHRMTSRVKDGGCICDPETLIAWQAFSMLDDAMDDLTSVLGLTDHVDTDFEA